jgi:hypothetical protein
MSTRSATASTFEDERFSIEALLEMIEEFQNSTDLETLHQLQQDNQSIRQEISHCEKAQEGTTRLLGVSYEIMLFLYDIMTRHAHGIAAAESDWLAFWGIYNKHENDLSS